MGGIDGSILKFFETAPISVATLLLNLVLATILAQLLSWHFRRFGSTFSNRSKFAGILLPLTLTTMLIITVIKTSLALSLGLVGALSIIRFRTPVKEPEELTYLFLAIATGLAVGASQQLLAALLVPAILVAMAVQTIFRATRKSPNLYLNVDIPDASGERPLAGLVESLGPHATHLDLRRYDVHNGSLQASFHVDLKSLDHMVSVQEEIRLRHPDATLTFVERSSAPGV